MTAPQAATLAERAARIVWASLAGTAAVLVVALPAVAL